jgi:DNA-binding response OmpR family regulator
MTISEMEPPRLLDEQPSNQRQPAPATGLKALVADDFPDAADSLALFLEYAGVEVLTAADGEAALLLALEWKPDIGIFDIQMPKMDGLALARAIRSQRWKKRPLLIAMTGWTQVVSEQSARDAGFDHWSKKPVDVMWLVTIIQNHFGLVRSES